MKCKIRFIEINTRSHWIVIETEKIAFLQLRDKHLFFIPLTIKEGILTKNENVYDFTYVDIGGGRVTHPFINRATIKIKNFMRFCKQHASNRLIIKMDKYFESLTKE